MTNHEFRDLCRATSCALNVAEAEALGEGNGIFVNDVKLGVFYDENVDEGIICYVDLGVIEPGYQAAVLEEVMDINLELDASYGEAIGFHRESGHLVLRAFIPLNEDLDEKYLAFRFNEYVELAKELYGGVLAHVTPPVKLIQKSV